MLLRKATELANFLTGNKRTAEAIAKFLVLKTFANYSPLALFIAELTDDGHLAPVGGFGFEKTAIARLGRVPLSLHMPITDVVRRDECIFIHNVEQLVTEYPSLEEIEGFVTEWELAMAWPILPFGVGFAFLDHPVDPFSRLAPFGGIPAKCRSTDFRSIPSVLAIFRLDIPVANKCSIR